MRLNQRVVDVKREIDWEVSRPTQAGAHLHIFMREYRVCFHTRNGTASGASDLNWCCAVLCCAVRDPFFVLMRVFTRTPSFPIAPSMLLNMLASTATRMQETPHNAAAELTSYHERCEHANDSLFLVPQLALNGCGSSIVELKSEDHEEQTMDHVSVSNRLADAIKLHTTTRQTSSGKPSGLPSPRLQRVIKAWLLAD
eukprot:COSAG02_NODE_3772_length_6254_cov_13.035906_2_plen_198_part_00